MQPIKVLYIGLKYDGGDSRRGFCYEYLNFLDTLNRMDGIETHFFAFDEEMRLKGRRAMNHALLQAVDEIRPALCFFVLRIDEIDRKTIQQISGRPGVVTLNWFCDDHWRFHPFSRHWAPLFHVSVTTYARAIDWYRALGCAQVVVSQWGFNHHLHAPQEQVIDYDVSFVGQAHSWRRNHIAALAKAGIHVVCRGRGWAGGMVSHEEMLGTFVGSRINLNFSESWSVAGLKPLASALVRRWADGSLRFNRPSVIAGHVQSLIRPAAPQIKARPFEVAGTGGFLMTAGADDLCSYLIPDEEIVVFDSMPDLCEKIRYYLEHQDQRETIRLAGHRRVLRDHSYEQRFRELFAQIGLLPSQSHVVQESLACAENRE
jgi:spore maturation protein CgeB